MDAQPSTNDLKWHANFNWLVRFKVAHGHCFVTRSNAVGEFSGLYNWVSYQRRRARHQGLEATKFDLLERLGLDLAPVPGLTLARLLPTEPEERPEVRERPTVFRPDPERFAIVMMAEWLGISIEEAIALQSAGEET